MSVTAAILFGMTKEQYLLDFPGDEEEAGKAYDKYIKQYEQVAECVNTKDVTRLKKLVDEFDWHRDDLCSFLEMME